MLFCFLIYFFEGANLEFQKRLYNISFPCKPIICMKKSFFFLNRFPGNSIWVIFFARKVSLIFLEREKNTGLFNGLSKGVY